MSSEPRRDCAACHHYRPQASFVDAYKGALDARKEQYEALNEVHKEETELLEGEAEMLVELCRSEDMTWPAKPRFAPMCGFTGGPFVAALKNRRGECSDYAPAFGRASRSCATCAHPEAPETFFGARMSVDSAAFRQEQRQQTIKHNEEVRDSDAAAKAMEIRQSFHGDGRIRSVSFLPTCGARFEGGHRHVPPACNLRSDCEEHQSLFTLPQHLLDSLRDEMSAPSDPMALGHSIRLIREISHASGPAALWESVRTWKGANAAEAWAAFCIRARWLPEAMPGQPIPAALAKMPDANPLREGALLPVIAGCDAFEWGILAAMSQGAGAGGVVAGVLCQQISEFARGALSPVARARAIEATRRLLSTPNLFSGETVERCTRFVKRLGVQAQLFDEAVRENPEAYFEKLLQEISFLVANYLRSAPEKAAGQSGRAAAVAARHFATRKARAKRRATEALALLHRVSSANAADSKVRTEALVQLLKENEQTLDELLSFEQEIAAAAGMDIDGEASQAIKMGLAMVQGQQKAQWTALWINPRKVAATLLLARGAAPFTPCVLELLGGEPTPDRVPESIEDAIQAPVQRTLEAFHAARFKQFLAAASDYLCRVRTTAEPRFLTTEK